MREILFRGKRRDGKWLYGLYSDDYVYDTDFPCIMPLRSEPDDFDWAIDRSTVGQYTGLTDKNGNKIFEGDIVRHNTYDGFDCHCHSVVRFGKYNQNGSDGEYYPTECLGWFVEVDNFTVPDFLEPTDFEGYLKTRNLLEIASDCEIIGNIHDNPELLEES